MVTVTKLITEAYYDSSVVARQFEQIQGYQLRDGLEWLNQILNDKAMDTGDIPYITQQYPLTGVVGQETYFIPNCISIDAITFYIGSVRYSMTFVDRIRYFQQPRANNINALPVSYTYERVYGGIRLWVYFWPQQPFLFNITGNFFMQNVALNQDLTSQIATANLGIPLVYGLPANLGAGTILGSGILAAGEIVLNGVDLAGTYSTLSAFVNAINANATVAVSAFLSGTNVTLYPTATTVTMTTLGTVTSSGVTFANFSTTSGAASKTITEGGKINAGGLVINGVDLAGIYPTATQLAETINTGIIPYVTADFDGMYFTLSSILGVSILVETNGMQSSSTGFSFSYFSTTFGIPLNQTYLPMALDGFYSNYLEYQLAERICSKLNFTVPEAAAMQLARYRLSITGMSEPMDLTQQKVSCLGDTRAINYAAVNIGRGYTVSGN